MKGDKCKFSHDLSIGRKAEKRSIYEDHREGSENGKQVNSVIYLPTITEDPFSYLFVSLLLCYMSASLDALILIKSTLCQLFYSWFCRHSWLLLTIVLAAADNRNDNDKKLFWCLLDPTRRSTSHTDWNKADCALQ